MGYDKSANVYNSIYTNRKNYKRESGLALNIAHQAHQYKQHKDGSFPESLLDVACGTGLHLEYFSRSIENVEGLDLSEEQLAVARRRLRSVPLHRGDMTDFDLGKSFDVITCLFSSIGHLLYREKLHAAMTCMARHLKPGGVVLVEPWIMPHAFKEGHIGIDVVDKPDLKIARFSTAKRTNNIIYLQMHHMVAEPENIEYFVENHELALYTQKEYEDAFRTAGLAVYFDPSGLSDNRRGLFIGVKPQ